MFYHSSSGCALDHASIFASATFETMVTQATATRDTSGVLVARGQSEPNASPEHTSSNTEGVCKDKARTLSVYRTGS